MYADGKPIYRSTKSHKISEAKRFRDQLLAKKVRGEINGGKPDRVLITELLDDVLLSDIAESTRKVWQYSVERNLRPFFGHLKAARLTSDMIEQYREKRVAEGRTQATANRELTILRTAYNNARKRTPPKVYHCPYFPMRAETTVRQGFLPDNAYTTLLNAITEPEVKLLFVIAYHTGIRKNELLSVRWPQVDLEAGFIDLSPETTKNGEGRRVPILSGDMNNLLVEAKRFRDKNFPNCSWVFHRSGKRVVDFRIAWEHATKAAGVDDLHFHDLRRTAVRNMRRAGVSQNIRMKISGHKTEAMERRYNIVDDEDLTIAKKRMEAVNRN